MKCTPMVLKILATMFPDMKVIDLINLVDNKGNINDIVLYENIEYENYLERLGINDNMPYMSIL